MTKEKYAPDLSSYISLEKWFCAQIELGNDQAVLPIMMVLPETLKEKYRLLWIKHRDIKRPQPAPQSEPVKPNKFTGSFVDKIAPKD